MEDKFDIALSGAKVDKNMLLDITSENVKRIIVQREKIIRNFAIENPRETLNFAVDEARKHLINIHKNAGIELQEKDIPEVVFIDEKRRKELNEKLDQFGGSNIQSDQAIASVWNGVSIIFLKNEIADLDQAGIIFHEMFHSVGRQVIAANENVAIYGRQGFQVFGINSPYKPWLLEEGLVSYESAKFVNSISTHSFYRKDAIKRAKMVEHLKRDGRIEDSRIKLASGMKVEPKYFLLNSRGLIFKEESFGLPEYSGLAGSLFEVVSDKFQQEERKDFINTLYAARRDLNLVPQIAGMIDKKLGKGTYSRMLKCKRTEEAVWDFIQDLKSE